MLLPYIVVQVIGAIVAAGVLYLIASGKPGFVLADFASNGYGDHSPGKYGATSALTCEVVMTFMFLLVILGTTHSRAPVGFAGLAIGLALTLIHLISMPVTNTSVNPARSTGPALFVGGWAIGRSGCSGWRPSSARSLQVSCIARSWNAKARAARRRSRRSWAGASAAIDWARGTAGSATPGARAASGWKVRRRFARRDRRGC